MIAILRPNADTGFMQWIPIPSRAHYLNINEEIVYPTWPNTSKFNVASVNGIRDQFLFTQLVGNYKITSIKAWVMGARANPTQGKITVKPIITGKTFASQDVVFTPSPVWRNVEWTGLDLTTADINSVKIQFQAYVPVAMTIPVFCLYIEITYEELYVPVPLPKRRKPMSGYNYFIKNYILRKNIGLEPYKLPTGELF